jgi:NAD(P)-dependent dehydrogenase (short-subunit alcohol dehydrogenase family)
MAGEREMTSLAGRTAFVTGAGSGLGRSIAIQLAAEGAQVVIADIIEANAKAVAETIVASGGKSAAVRCDVSDRASVRAARQAAERAFGTVSLLFANAGATSFERMAGISDDEIDWIIQVNLMGVINCVQMFLPGMIEARGGHIVATSSPAGLIPTLLTDHAPYAAAKAGIIGFLENLSMEIAEFGIRTTVVYPSNVATVMGRQNSTYRPERFGGPFDSPIVVPADYVPPPQQSPDNAAEVVLEAVRKDLRMIVTGPEFRERFLDEYVAVAVRAFDAAKEFREAIDVRDSVSC